MGQLLVAFVNEAPQTFGPLISDHIPAQIQPRQHLLVVEKLAQFDHMFIHDALLFKNYYVWLVNAPRFYCRGKTLRNFGTFREFYFKEGLIDVYALFCS